MCACVCVCVCVRGRVCGCVGVCASTHRVSMKQVLSGHAREGGRHPDVIERELNGHAVHGCVRQCSNLMRRTWVCVSKIDKICFSYRLGHALD